MGLDFEIPDKIGLLGRFKFSELRQYWSHSGIARLAVTGIMTKLRDTAIRRERTFFGDGAAGLIALARHRRVEGRRDLWTYRLVPDHTDASYYGHPPAQTSST